MKYIKLYEARKTPKVGDYVICYEVGNNRIEKFIRNRIGKIKEISSKDESSFPFIVIYPEDPSGKKYILNQDEDGLNEEEDGYTRRFARNEIIHFSPNKDDLETISANSGPPASKGLPAAISLRLATDRT